MKKYFAILAGAAAILASCAKETETLRENQSAENISETRNTHPVTIEASVAPSTKTTLEIDGKVGHYLWEADETVAVAETNSEEILTFSVNDRDNGLFKGFVTDGEEPLYAVTPASALTQSSTLVEDGESLVEFTLTLPSQYLDYVPGTTNTVMFGQKVEADGDNYKFEFRQAAAVLKLTVENLPEGTYGMEFTADQFIAGSYNFDSLDGIELVADDIDDSKDFDNTVLFYFKDGSITKNNSYDFFIPIPTGDYTEFGFVFKNRAWETIEGTDKTLRGFNLNVKKGNIIPMPVLTLEPAPNAFVKVTDEKDLTDGQYLIVYEEGNVAMNGNQETIDTKESGLAISIADNEIAASDDVNDASFTFSVSKGTFVSTNGVYIGKTSDANGLDEKTTELTNTVSIEKDGTAKIVGSGNAVLRFNASKGEERFRYFKSTTYTSQKAVALYKYDGEFKVKGANGLAFSKTEITLVEGEELVAPTLTNEHNLPVTFASDNESVVKVTDAATGAVELGGETGTATITATFAGNDDYKAGSVSYTVKVIPDATLKTIGELKDFIDEMGSTESPATVEFNNALVTWTNGSKAYIEDATGGIYVYAGATEELAAGDVLNGKTELKAKLYNGQREVTAVTGTALAELKTATKAVTATEATVEEANSGDLENQRVEIKKVSISVSGSTYYLVDGSNKIQLYALGGLGISFTSLSDGVYVASAVGYPMNYKGTTPELVIVDLDDIVIKAKPTITATPATYNFPKEGGSQDFTLAVENFSGTPEITVDANTNPTVFKTSISSTKLTVTVEENTGDGQVGELTLKAAYADEDETATCTISLTQDSPVAGWVKKNLADITENDIFVIVGTVSKKNYAMNHADLNTSGAPKATEVTVSGTKLAAAPAAGVQWVLTSGTDGYMFYPANNGKKTWLNLTNENNGLRVSSTSTNGKYWSLDESGYLKGTDTKPQTRYLGIYSTTDWRSYTSSTATNIKDQTFAFYVNVGANTETGEDPTTATYSINIASTSNGKVEASKTTGITAGESVTLTVTPNSGYELEKLTVDGSDVTASVSGGKYTFDMPANDVAVSADFKNAQGGNTDGETNIYTMTIDSSNNGNNNVHWTSANTTSLSYDNITWSTSITGTTSITAQKTYAQIGSQNKPATKVELSTTGFAGKKIKSVTVSAYCMSNDGPTITITGGSTTMLSAEALQKTNSKDHKTTVSDVTLGQDDDLKITFNSSAKAAIAISKIVVEYYN